MRERPQRFHPNRVEKFIRQVRDIFPKPNETNTISVYRITHWVTKMTVTDIPDTIKNCEYVYALNIIYESEHIAKFIQVLRNASEKMLTEGKEIDEDEEDVDDYFRNGRLRLYTKKYDFCMQMLHDLAPDTNF